jgi:mRNA interferase RelE/StbE
MKYFIEFKKRAVKDLKKINKKDSIKILNELKKTEDGLQGDIRRLTNYSPEYRLRIGSYRILFEILGNKIFIYKIKYRKDSYKK